LTRYGLFSLIPPFFMFIAVLHAFQGDDEAWLMIRYLAGLAVIFCLYGLLQSQFFPDHVLIKELKSPNHKFTSVLINRNHAGTLLGVSGLLMLALVINRARGVALIKLPERIVLPSNLKSEKRRGIIVWILGLFLTLICLFLTQSRGAFGATIIAWAAILPALLSHAL
ncbi:MAG: hypothetical protein OIF54_05635, partial [Cohaesibacter sp.]|nr:hypothetical protein [Cohaesibacter sp.]